MRIMLIRHGQSEGNKIGVLQGHSDYQLSEQGRIEARALGLKLFRNKESFVAIYSSDLSRAAETAEIIALETNFENVHFDNRLREFNLGIFEGKYSQFMTEEENDLLSSCWKDTTKRVPNGETVIEMIKRINEVFNEIIERHNQNETVIIVAHGGTLYHIIQTILGFDLKGREWFDNCKITEVVQNSETKSWELVKYNDETLIS
ncbi:MAG: histidine phosphatase family protein [Candidatus Heimdallarchaeota archaeon]|nr:histidine phosphatase family protein [Candidatus Heimdallarchaeota archaeon]